MFSKLGYSLSIVDNGQQAWELVNSEAFDLVFMDVQMPIMDGLTATRQIRKSYPSDQLTIIAMTANALSGDRQDCLAAGMDDFLPKPIVPQALVDCIESWGQNLNKVKG